MGPGGRGNPRSGLPLGPRLLRLKLLLLSLFQKGINGDTSLEALGLRPLCLLGVLEKTRSLEEVPKGDEGLREAADLWQLQTAVPAPLPPRALEDRRGAGLVCSGIPSPPSLLALSGLRARPGEPGPRQLGQVSGKLAGRRVQTPDEAGSGGCRGNWASGPGRKLAREEKKIRSCLQDSAGAPRSRGAPPPQPSRTPGSSCFGFRVDSQPSGQRGSSWVATAPPVPVLWLPGVSSLPRGEGCSWFP